MNRFIDSLIKMPQISKHELPQELETEIFSQFCTFLAQINSSNLMQSFLVDFLTPTEKIMLAKRYMIMVLLNRGHRPSEIKSILNVSGTTIFSVSAWLKYPSPSTARMLVRLNKDKNLSQIFDKFEELLDKLPPPKYRNWSKVAKEKASRARTRQTRSKLR